MAEIEYPAPIWPNSRQNSHQAIENISEKSYPTWYCNIKFLVLGKTGISLDLVIFEYSIVQCTPCCSLHVQYNTDPQSGMRTFRFAASLLYITFFSLFSSLSFRRPNNFQLIESHVWNAKNFSGNFFSFCVSLWAAFRSTAAFSGTYPTHKAKNFEEIL